MKKIFYSMMAVALCACSQSEVDDMPTPPQPENKGVTFTVVDNGFVDGDGTRVKYGDFGTADAYTATFEEGNQIGLYAITAMGSDKTPTTYKFENKPLTLKNGKWVSAEPLDLTGVTLLFAYAPYRSDANLENGKPLFTGSEGSWAISKDNNRFFVWPYDTYLNNSSKDLFEKADWMGAAVNLTGNETAITFNMEHMREMIELTTHKDATLENLTLAIGTSETADKYIFTPYHINADDPDRNINIYRFLTTEYRYVNVVYATVTYKGEQKQYKKTLSGNGAGKCFWVNISSEAITVGSEPLSTILTREYGADYATNPELMSLRLTGKLQGANKDEGDWATLRSLQHLRSLNMSALTNEEIPDKWIWRGDDEKNKTKLCETLTTLILPNNLKRIGNNALQPNNQLTKIELPASVTTLDNGAFWGNGTMSIRIPEDSQLQSIGHGAFQYVKAVYTNPNSVNVLTIPASVTSISDYAFANISSMGKVIFQPTQSAEAPTFGGTHVFDSNNAMIYVPDKTKYSGNFPGKTVIVGPVLTTENYTSPYTITYDGQGLPALCDGSNATFWHTPWSGASEGDTTYGQYIDVTIPEGVTMTSLMVRYVTRSNNNAVPVKVDIYTNNGEKWVKLVALPKAGEELPTDGNASYITDKLTPAASFTKIRFAVTEAKGGSLCGAIGTDTNGYAVASTSLAELTIGEEIWIDTAAN